jgi:hypothetical protein
LKFIFYLVLINQKNHFCLYNLYNTTQKSLFSLKYFTFIEIMCLVYKNIHFIKSWFLIWNEN